VCVCVCVCVCVYIYYTCYWNLFKGWSILGWFVGNVSHIYIYAMLSRCCCSCCHCTVVELYVDIHKWSTLHNHNLVRAHALERLVVQLVRAYAPWMLVHSIWWGLMPCECFNHSNWWGLMPWNASSFKRVKCYHMHVHCRICRWVISVLSCHCMSRYCRLSNRCMVGCNWICW